MTQTELPSLTQFRVEPQENGLIHLVFDCPGRSMNVFSNKAIHELGAFAEWLHRSDVRGVVVRSGKASGFCAGADLTELGVAYDMIVAAPPADRFDLAFDHFFALSHALRRLETSGRPVAAAINGVALGGGCELALASHYRAASNAPRTILGLPECGVGLLPGAGGTQRMPRLVGVELGLEVLLLGRNLQGQAALDAGLIDAVVDDGDEVAAAEAWLLSPAATSVQRWDAPGVVPFDHAQLADAIERHRMRELARMLGHEPAPIAILDCVELGLMQQIDGAIRTEMSLFAALIQRKEARNTVRTMFLGKQAYERAIRTGSLADGVEATAQTVFSLVTAAVESCPELSSAGFLGIPKDHRAVQHRVSRDFWLTTQPTLAATVAELAAKVAVSIEGLDADALLQLDHACMRNGSIPAYLGGATGLTELSNGRLSA